MQDPRSSPLQYSEYYKQLHIRNVSQFWFCYFISLYACVLYSSAHLGLNSMLLGSNGLSARNICPCVGRCLFHVEAVVQTRVLNCSTKHSLILRRRSNVFLKLTHIAATEMNCTSLNWTIAVSHDQSKWRSRETFISEAETFAKTQVSRHETSQDVLN